MKKDKSRPGATPEQLVEAARKCLKTSEYDSGINYCNKALEIDGQYAEAYCVRGAIHNAENDFDAAIEDLVKSIELNPTPVAYSLLGDTWCEKYDFEAAVENYNKVLEFDPGDATAINDRAEAYFYMGDYNNAIQDYENLISRFPEEPSPYYNRGACYRRKGAFGKAIENFDKTIELGNREVHVYKSRGLAYMDMGEYDKAIADFKLVEELGDDFGSLYAKEAMKKQAACREYSFERNKNPDGDKDGDKDGILDINKIHAMEDELLERYGGIGFYRKFLCDKFVDFVTNKEILDSFIRISAEGLEPVAKYALVMFGGLIVSCFELPVFKSRQSEGGREEEMARYMGDFLEKSKFLISDLDLALAFEDNDLKKEYADFIRNNDLLTESELEPVYENIYGVLARYSTKQPVLRDYIAKHVFTSSLECTTKSKIFLFTFLYFIIDFLSEYYFD